MLLHVFYAVLYFVLLLGAAYRQKPEGQSFVDNMTQIDKEGPYFVKNNLDESEENRLLAQIRGFLWEHWKKQRPGELQATFYTVEGDPTSYTFFIENDGKGHWVIRAKSDSQLSALLPPGHPPKHETATVLYSVVERIDPATKKTVPPNQVLLPEAYRLRLRSEGEAPSLTL
jgi:hypothetical protein